MKNRNFYYFVMASVLFFLSLALRLNHISYSGFSLDEMVSLGLSEHLDHRTLFLDNHPPLLQVILKVFTTIFGLNELSARFPSALFSAMTTALIGRLTYLKYGRRVSLLAMLLHAILPLSIVLGQLVRPYAVLEFFGLLQIYYFTKYLNDKANSLKLLIASLLCILTSYQVVLLFIGEFIYIQILKKRYHVIFWSSALLMFAIFSSGGLLNLRSLNWQLIRFQQEKFAFLPVQPIWAYLFSSFFSAAGILILFFIESIKMKVEDFRKFVPVIISILAVVLNLIAIAYVSSRAIFVERYYEFLAPTFLIFLSFIICRNLRQKDPKFFYPTILSLILIVAGAGERLYHLYPIKQARWKDAALNISIFSSSSIVVTNVGARLKFPYFDRYQIPVTQMENFEQPLTSIVENLQLYQNVWLVDSAWSYIQYRDKLLPGAKTLRLKIDDYSTLEDNVDNIVVLRFRK